MSYRTVNTIQTENLTIDSAYKKKERSPCGVVMPDEPFSTGTVVTGAIALEW